jgi:hypothetical protein
MITLMMTHQPGAATGVGIDLRLGQKPKLGGRYADDSLIYTSYFVGSLYIRVSLCNNPNFWEIEINGFIKILNFGDNKNFYFKYKINLLSFKTCEFEHLLPCFK